MLRLIYKFLLLLKEWRYVFDRGEENVDPIGVYFLLSGIKEKCTWIRGNHDQWLADYIKKYYSKPDRKRLKMSSYPSVMQTKEYYLMGNYDLDISLSKELMVIFRHVVILRQEMYYGIETDPCIFVGLWLRFSKWAISLYVPGRIERSV